MPPETDLLERAARAAATSFRLGMEAQANRALVSLVDALGTNPPVRLEGAVSELLAAQVRGDVIGLADLLEFELLPALTTGGGA